MRFKVYPVVSVFVILVFCAICVLHAADVQLSGQQLYMEYCSSCHGQRLQGGNAQSLIDGVWQFGDARGYRTRNIKYGITHLGMPAYEKTLNDKQIKQIVDFLEASEKEAGSKKPGIPENLQTLDYDINVEILAEGLEVPWAIDFLDKDHALVTERPGRLRVIENGKLLAEPIQNTPKVLNEGQGGLMDVAVDPAYDKNGWVYLAYSHALENSSDKNRPGAMTRIVRGRIKKGTWTDEQVLYEAPPETYRTTRHHYGCRIVFDKKGFLYFGIGDRGAMEHAQDMSLPNGKIHRIYTDGKVPQDNPFVDQKNALPTIYSYGIRNPQGLAVHPGTDDLWETEHGPMGGDEVNLIKAGVNYGWPVISYGRNYNGSIITELVEKEGMAQPLYYWRPSIAVCGMDFVTGELFSKWKNHILVTALKYEEVRLLDVKNDRVLHDEVILKNAGRVRDVACGPDGAIYVVLNKPGMILKLTPMK